ncbi:MAG TPA: class I SAM-dependent methyltransferase [Caulobacteraceae bacterium]|nr:class I SAM-dependent methyltransferase [Caulobacteraceae bacterium]
MAGRAGLGEAGRDTDADWRRLAETEPYWAVLSNPDFKRDALREDTLEDFYASGRPQIAHSAAGLARLIDAPLEVRTALDFGCGVGRLTEAMTAYADEVVGYDIAPGMLQAARTRPLGAKINYVDSLPDGPFDWINSAIVFQHIPPQRGLKLLEALLGRLRPGGVASLQFTVSREAHLKRPLLKRLIRQIVPEAPGVMSMYDYDFSAILHRLNQNGIQKMMLETTNHGGYHGVLILGRREAASPSGAH